MKLTWARRISQVFFLALFLWLGAVAAEGRGWLQADGWPINLFLELDPLAMLGVLASSGVIHGAMLLSLLVLLLTFLWGRVFCGFICPLGAINHFMGWLSLYGQKAANKLKLNQYHHAQKIKYYLLALFVAAALAGQYLIFVDPIPLLQRGYTLALKPLWDIGRQYQYAAPLAVALVVIIMANLWRPRFFCRYVCPLGAMLGLASRISWWRPTLIESKCSKCQKCAGKCQAAADPQDGLRAGECVMCLNCLETCPEGALVFKAASQPPSKAIDPSRRMALSALAIGAVGVASQPEPTTRLRPPGALGEQQFIARCLRCGQCIAICPGNVLQPVSLLHGLDNYLTPTLNFNMGSCRIDCNACGQACPSAAITPFSKAMRLGLDGSHPIRLGLAAIDKNTCLPWAFNRPCLVCEENCPVSPKAITTHSSYHPLNNWLAVKTVAENGDITLNGELPPNISRDVWARLRHMNNMLAIHSVSQSHINLGAASSLVQPGHELRLYLHLARPQVNPDLCVGCGVCQNLCPLEQAKGVRVWPENKTSSRLFV